MWGCPRDRLQNDTLNEQAFSSRYLCHSTWSQTHTNGIQYKISRMALKKNPGDSYRGASVKCDQMPLSNGAVTIKISEEGYVDRFSTLSPLLQCSAFRWSRQRTEGAATLIFKNCSVHFLHLLRDSTWKPTCKCYVVTWKKLSVSK